MRKIHFYVLAVLACATSPALAAETPCGIWETSVTTFAGEGEGLNAHLCVEAPAQELSFEITCAGQQMSIRFMPTGFDLNEDMGNRKTKLHYIVDGKTYVLDSQFEELDGAFAADIGTKHPLVNALAVGRSLVVSLYQKKVIVYKVPLKGSTRAFKKLLRNCS